MVNNDAIYVPARRAGDLAVHIYANRVLMGSKMPPMMVSYNHKSALHRQQEHVNMTFASAPIAKMNF